MLILTSLCAAWPQSTQGQNEHSLRGLESLLEQKERGRLIEKARRPDPEVTEQWNASLRNYRQRMAELTPAAAASGWMKLAVDAQKLLRRDKPYSQLLQALPGPESWHELDRLANALPEDTGEHRIMIRFLCAQLNGTVTDELMQELTEDDTTDWDYLVQMAPPEERWAAVLNNQQHQFIPRLGMLRDKKRFLQQLSENIEQAGQFHCPDPATEDFIRQAVLEHGDNALSMFWGIVFSLDSGPLIERTWKAVEEENGETVNDTLSGWLAVHWILENDPRVEDFLLTEGCPLDDEQLMMAIYQRRASRTVSRFLKDFLTAHPDQVHLLEAYSKINVMHGAEQETLELLTKLSPELRKNVQVRIAMAKALLNVGQTEASIKEFSRLLARRKLRTKHRLKITELLIQVGTQLGKQDCIDSAMEHLLTLTEMGPETAGQPAWQIDSTRPSARRGKAVVSCRAAGCALPSAATPVKGIYSGSQTEALPIAGQHLPSGRPTS